MGDAGLVNTWCSSDSPGGPHSAPARDKLDTSRFLLFSLQLKKNSFLCGTALAALVSGVGWEAEG